MLIQANLLVVILISLGPAHGCLFGWGKSSTPTGSDSTDAASECPFNDGLEQTAKDKLQPLVDDFLTDSKASEASGSHNGADLRGVVTNFCTWLKAIDSLPSFAYGMSDLEGFKTTLEGMHLSPSDIVDAINKIIEAIKQLSA